MRRTGDRSRSNDGFPAKTTYNRHTEPDSDIKQMMREMSSAITALNKRVDKLFTTGGGRTAPARGGTPEPHYKSGRYSDYKNSAHHEDEDHFQADEPRSSNQDFATIAKALFRVIQARHHLENWKTAPNSIEEGIDDLLSNIKPPMADDLFLADMESLGQEIGHRLCEINLRHLERVITNMASVVGPLPTMDLDRAKAIADKYAQQRLGKRLSTEKRKEFLEDAAAMVGVARARTPPGTPWTTVTSKKSKRRKPGSCASSEEDPTEAMIADVEPATTPPVPPARVTPEEALPPRDKRTRPEFYHKTVLKTGVVVYNCNMDEWEIEPTGNKPWIMIADSNMREATEIPPNLEIHCMPGAKLIHGAKAIQRMKTNKKFSFLVQLGINNRQDNEDAIEREGRALIAALDGHPCVQDMAFVLVSSPPSISRHETKILQALNEGLVDAVGAENCVQPLPTDTLQVRSTDPSGIHFLPETINQILNSADSIMNKAVFHPGKA